MLKFDCRTLQAPVPPPAPVSPAPGGAYNLGHYFPRVSSEPPSRKSYQTASRNGDPLKVSSLPCFFFSLFCEVSEEDIVAKTIQDNRYILRILQKEVLNNLFYGDNSIFCMTRNLGNKPEILIFTIT